MDTEPHCFHGILSILGNDLGCVMILISVTEMWVLGQSNSCNTGLDSSALAHICLLLHKCMNANIHTYMCIHTHEYIVNKKN